MYTHCLHSAADQTHLLQQMGLGPHTYVATEAALIETTKASNHRCRKSGHSCPAALEGSCTAHFRSSSRNRHVYRRQEPCLPFKTGCSHKAGLAWQFLGRQHTTLAVACHSKLTPRQPTNN